MPVKIIDGDLFDTSANYIYHQVNCKGRMGSGVAKQVRAKYTSVYAAYQQECMAGGGDPFWTFCLRTLQAANDRKSIVNMFAQSGYGYDGKLYTDYAAFQSCLNEIRNKVPKGETIAMPYKIGCSLGGGDWETILSHIENVLAPHYTVELWRKEV